MPTLRGRIWGIALDYTLQVTPTLNPTGALYYRTGAYTRADLRIDYKVLDGLVLAAGVRNAFDENFALTDGFPEPGRSFYVSADRNSDCCTWSDDDRFGVDFRMTTLRKRPRRSCKSRPK